jgi:hypothetical protein
LELGGNWGGIGLFVFGVVVVGSGGVGMIRSFVGASCGSGFGLVFVEKFDSFFELGVGDTVADASFAYRF